MNEQLKLHDIKGLETIPDISFYIFILLIILAFAIVSIILFFIYRYFKNKKPNKRKEYYEILKTLDFTDPKECAYKITKYTRLLARNEREKKLCFELIEELDKYKYKKEVLPLDNHIKVNFDRFMDIVDV